MSDIIPSVPEYGRGALALPLEHVHVGDVLVDARAGGAEGAARVHAILQNVKKNSYTG